MCFKEPRFPSIERPVLYHWKQLPDLQMKQIDAGLTNALWGINPAGQPQVYLRDSWVPVSGTFKSISSGEAGVWAVKGDGQVFYRAGISKLNPTGMRWKLISGYFKQVDSGEKGVVYGIDSQKELRCRSGIQKGLPTGLHWKRIEGSYKRVTCGYRGCWAITDDNKVLFRMGVTANYCQGSSWVSVTPPKNLMYIESGADGILWAVTQGGEIWYRKGVDDVHPYGNQWTKLNLHGRFSMITSGLIGQYALDNSGYVYHLEGKCNYAYHLRVVCLKKKIQTIQNSPTACSKAWKCFFRNLVRISSSFGF